MAAGMTIGTVTEGNDINQHGAVEIFKLLEANGANIYEVESFKKDVITQAASVGNVALLRYLIEIKKMEVDSLKFLSTTSLIVASENGHIDSVRYLLYHGADQTIEGGNGLTALEEAEKNGHEEIVRVLSE